MLHKFTMETNSPRKLERDFIDEIKRLELHPFILVRLGPTPASRRFIHCRTQNEAPDFVRAIGSVPRFAKSLLVRGIERALRQEILEAADLLYRWTGSEGLITETVHIFDPGNKNIIPIYNYPVFAFDCTSAPDIGNSRIHALLNMLEAYASTQGNNAQRYSLMEATALALARALGAEGKYKDALSAVEKVLKIEPDSHYLWAAKQTLFRKSEGKSVSPQMQRFAADDSVGPQPAWPWPGGAQLSPAADIELIERFSQHWKANANSYQQTLVDLRNAARRLLPILLRPKLNSVMLTLTENDRLRALEKEVVCLARQPLFFPEMFHGVTLLSDGSFRELDSELKKHLYASGLLGTEDRAAIRQVYERLLGSSPSPLRVVEIGSAAGRGSTPVAVELVKLSGGILYCVDTWESPHSGDPSTDSFYYAFLSNIQIFDLEHTIVPIRSSSVEAAALFDDGSLDAVFVDGNHLYQYVLADIDTYLPKIKKGGIMFGHDLYDVPSRFDRSELLSIAELNNGPAKHTNSKGDVERVDVHPGVILAVQDRFGDGVEHFSGSSVWAKQL